MISEKGRDRGGSPQLAARAALATIETIEQDGLLERAGQIGEKFRARFLALKEKSPLVSEVRVKGTNSVGAAVCAGQGAGSAPKSGEPSVKDDVGLDDEGNALRSEPIRQHVAALVHPAKYRPVGDAGGSQPVLHGSDRTSDRATADRDHGAGALLVSL